MWWYPWRLATSMLARRFHPWHHKRAPEIRWRAIFEVLPTPSRYTGHTACVVFSTFGSEKNYACCLNCVLGLVCFRWSKPQDVQSFRGAYKCCVSSHWPRWQQLLPLLAAKLLAPSGGGTVVRRGRLLWFVGRFVRRILWFVRWFVRRFERRLLRFVGRFIGRILWLVRRFVRRRPVPSSSSPLLLGWLWFVGRFVRRLLRLVGWFVRRILGRLRRGRGGSSGGWGSSGGSSGGYSTMSVSLRHDRSGRHAHDRAR